MIRARDFADVISGHIDLPVGSLDNVPVHFSKYNNSPAWRQP